METIVAIWTWVESAWSWLQDNQGPLVAIGTIVLAAITIVYVFQTGSLSKSAERSAESAERLIQLESLPMVYARRGPHSQGGGQKQSVVLRVRNVGRVAAFDVHAWFRIGEEDEDGYQTIGSELVSTIMEPGEGNDRGITISDGQARVFTTQPSPVYAVAQFTDGFGGTYKTEWRGTELAMYQLVGQGPPTWQRVNQPKHVDAD